MHHHLFSLIEPENHPFFPLKASKLMTCCTHLKKWIFNLAGRRRSIDKDKTNKSDPYRDDIDPDGSQMNIESSSRFFVTLYTSNSIMADEINRKNDKMDE